MPKAFFTQCVAILLKAPLPISEIAEQLSKYSCDTRNPVALEWFTGGPAVIVPFRRESNGAVCVDVAGARWPDSMGNESNERALFAAWATGNFGPFTYPGALQRAVQHALHWPDAPTVVQQHQAFVRVRVSYSMGQHLDEAIALPDDYDWTAELEFVASITQDLLRMPGSLCYFNPNAEIVCTREAFDESLGMARAAKQFPMELWSAVRFWDTGAESLLIDSVGNGQFDTPDVELVFPNAPDSFEQEALFLRTVSGLLATHGLGWCQSDGVMTTIDGPDGSRWQATLADSATDPPRKVVRFEPTREDPRSHERPI